MSGFRRMQNILKNKTNFNKYTTPSQKMMNLLTVLKKDPIWILTQKIFIKDNQGNMIRFDI